MDNWDDYTLSTEEYEKRVNDQNVSPDMTATYDFSDMVRDMKESSSEDPMAKLEELASEPVAEHHYEEASGHTGEGVYKEPAYEAEAAAPEVHEPEVHEPAFTEVSADAQTTPLAEPAAVQDGEYGFTMHDPAPAEQTAASFEEELSQYTPRDFTHTEYEPSGTYQQSASAGSYGASSYSYSAGGAGGYGGNGGSYGGNGGYDGGRGKKKKKKPMEITRLGFVLTLIFCMLLTSALTVAGLAWYGSNFAPGTDNATDYTLTSSDETLSYNSIINKVQDSVVSITTESTAYDMWMQNYVTQGAGSGVIIQSDGYIATCNHVIEGASKITVTLNNGKDYEATVVGADPDNDVAVLKIKETGLKAATYGDSSKLDVGDAVVAVGNPLGELSNTATTGIISALDRELTIDGKTMNLLQTDASINPGNSGGALFDAAGNLIGIVVAKSTGSDVEGLGFAIPINRVAELAKDMIDNEGSYNAGSGKDSKDEFGDGDAVIGITVDEISDEEAAQYGYISGGILIRSVTSQYAQAAGLEAGDVLVSFDGDKVSTVDELHAKLKDHKPGDQVEVELVRGAQQIKTTVTLSEANNQ